MGRKSCQSEAEAKDNCPKLRLNARVVSPLANRAHYIGSHGVTFLRRQCYHTAALRIKSIFGLSFTSCTTAAMHLVIQAGFLARNGEKRNCHDTVQTDEAEPQEGRSGPNAGTFSNTTKSVWDRDTAAAADDRFRSESI